MGKVRQHLEEQFQQCPALDQWGDYAAIMPSLESHPKLPASNTWVVANHANAFKAGHIQVFLVGKELLKVLLARGVALEKVARPLLAAQSTHRRGHAPRLQLAHS
jgi:hypothetical protein